MIIEFPQKKKNILRKPRNREDYLEIIKDNLPPWDYHDVLCGILDKDIFDKLNPKLQKIIACYYEL